MIGGPRYVSLAEAAKIAGVSTSTFHKWLEQDGLRILVSERDVQAVIGKRTGGRRSVEAKIAEEKQRGNSTGREGSD
jgi:hypothetical protein